LKLAWDGIAVTLGFAMPKKRKAVAAKKATKAAGSKKAAKPEGVARPRKTASPKKKAISAEKTGGVSKPSPPPTADAGPQLDTSVAFASDGEAAWVLGKSTAELWGFRMPEADQALLFPFSNVYDVWTSSGGTSYIAGWSKYPIVTCADGKFAFIEGPAGIDRILCIDGWSGGTPSGDTLFCLAEPYRINEAPECSLAWRQESRWRTARLRAGHAGALTAGLDGHVYIGIRRAKAREWLPGQLLRWRDGELEALRFPREEELVPTNVIALHAMPDGRLLTLFGGSEEWVRPWVRSQDGSWERIEAPVRFLVFGGRTVCRWHQGKVLLPTLQGVFSWDGAGPLRRESDFAAASIHPIPGGLLCRGWSHGKTAHQIDDGRGWRRLHVPEPDHVAGGRGKWITLGGGPELPVVKPRMKAPSPSAAPAAESESPPEVSLGSFLRRLETISTPRATPLDAVGEIERHAGVAMAPDLRAFFGVFGVRAFRGGVAHLYLYGDSFWLPDGGDSDALVARVLDDHRGLLAALTSTVYLGEDAGGQWYFAALEGARSEVFLYSHGVGEMKFFCDSLSTFAELCEIEDQWEAYCEEHGADDDDLEDQAVVVASARLRALRDALCDRLGRLNLSRKGSDVASDFDDTMMRLAGMELEASSATKVGDLFDRAQWLFQLLAGSPPILQEMRGDIDADLRDPELGTLAATKVRGLWHLYLVGRDGELGAFVEACRRDPSALVRATADLMVRLAGAETRPAPLQRFRELRSVVLDALAGHERPVPSEEEKRADEERMAEARLRRLVEPRESDSPRLRDHKALVSKDVQKPQSWDALTYAYYGDKLYDHMLEAAEARLSIDRYSYFPWLQKAVALISLGRPADALPALDEALFWDRENDQAVAWLNKSLIYAERGEREMALLHLGEAVRLCPEHKVFAGQASQFASYRDDPEFQALLR
jgi:hypothetical protein